MPSIRCEEHGLSFDPTQQTGCVLCRRTKKPAEPVRRPRPYFLWASVGIAAFCLTALLVAQRQVARQAAPLDDSASVVASAGQPAGQSPGQPINWAIKPGQPLPTTPPDLTRNDGKFLVGKWQWIPSSDASLQGRLEFQRDGNVSLERDGKWWYGRYAFAGQRTLVLDLAPRGSDRIRRLQLYFQINKQRLRLARSPGGAPAVFGALN